MGRIELKNLLIKCCYWYYIGLNSLLTDKQYDHAIYRLKKLEQESGEYDKDSPTQMVYGDLESQYPEWAKEK